MSNFTPTEIKFIRSCAESAIINETTRLGQGNMSSENANWTQERIKLARGLLAKLKEDGKPITAEWLESVGATKDTRFSWVEYRFDTCDRFFELVASFFDGSQNVKLMHYERGNILPHIKTRHQFSELCWLLAGRELGE